MKILKFIGKLFRWYFLGIGYICYLLYLLVKYAFFYIGYLLSAVFYFIFSVLTFKHIRNAKKGKIISPKEIVDNMENLTDLDNDQNVVEAPIVTDVNNYSQVPEQVNNVDFETQNNNQNFDQNMVIDNNLNQNSEENLDNDIPYETELSVNNANFKAETFDPNNQGNLGYHVFVENNNIAEHKNEDLLKVSNEPKQIIKEGKLSKTAKSEEKVFKDIDVKQTFRERLAVAFPTLFQASDERKREREEARQSKKMYEDVENVIVNTEEKKSLGPKTVYEYTARDKNGKLVKNYYEAYSLVEVQSYLLSEGYDIYKIRTNQTINLLHRTTSAKKRMKTSDMVFFLTQLKRLYQY